MKRGTHRMTTVKHFFILKIICHAVLPLISITTRMADWSFGRYVDMMPTFGPLTAPWSFPLGGGLSVF